MGKKKKNMRRSASASKKKAEAAKKKVSAAEAKENLAKKAKARTDAAEKAKRSAAKAVEAEKGKAKKAAKPAPADKIQAKKAVVSPKNKKAPKPAEATPRKPRSRRVGETVVAVISILLIVIFVPVIVVNGILIVKGLTDPAHVPMVFGWGFVTARADSMSPTFNSGDMIVIRQCDPADVVVDDVISFYTESVDGKTALLTRRVAAVVHNDDGTTSFRSRGDENLDVDTFFIAAEDVVGLYRTSVPKLGSVMEFMTKPQGVLLFAVLPLCLLFLADSLIFSRMKAKEETEPNAGKPGGDAPGDTVIYVPDAQAEATEDEEPPASQADNPEDEEPPASADTP